MTNRNHTFSISGIDKIDRLPAGAVVLSHTVAQLLIVKFKSMMENMTTEEFNVALEAMKNESQLTLDNIVDSVFNPEKRVK